MPQEAPNSHAAAQTSILKTHLKFPSKMGELEKLDRVNSLPIHPKDRQAQDAAPCSHTPLPANGH